MKLIKVGKEYAERILNLQLVAFKELLDKYQDYDISPGTEGLEDIIRRMNQDYTQYYLIRHQDVDIGAIRVVKGKVKGEDECRISPMFIISEYQGLGLAQESIKAVENFYEVDTWTLDTILEEEKLCYLYEKLGYIKTGRVEEIKTNMHIVYYEKVRRNEY